MKTRDPRRRAESYELARIKEQVTQLLASYRRVGASQNLRSRSLDGRDRELRFWLMWLEQERRLRPLHMLTADDITGYIVHEQERGIADSTIATLWNHLHAFCAWLVREEVIDRSPMANLQTPIVGKKVTPILSDEEVRRLLATCEGRDFQHRRDMAIIRFLLDTGLRCSEFLSIMLAGVDLNKQLVLVPSKGHDERVVTYGQNTAKALDRYIWVRQLHLHADNPALWLSKRGAMCSSTLRTMMRKRGDQAGLDMWPHRLRHQFAHLWLKDGGQERDLMRLAGWTTPAMLARYGAAAATQRALDAHRKHSPGDKF